MTDNIYQNEAFVYKWTYYGPTKTIERKKYKSGEYYIGSHKGNPSDGYIASGTLFNKHILKETNNSWKREILFSGTYNDAFALEKYLLETHIEDELCLNLNIAGKNIWTNKRKVKTSNRLKESWKNEDYRKTLCNMTKNLWSDPTYINKHRKSMKLSFLRRIYRCMTDPKNTRGTMWHKGTKKYMTKIHINKKTFSKYFNSLEDAIKYRNEIWITHYPHMISLMYHQR